MRTVSDCNHHLEQQLAIEQWTKNQNLADLDVPDFTDFVVEDELVRESFQLDLLYLCWLDMLHSSKASH
ncbi:MAG: hypothetical protein KGR70_16430 [Cyanobacteria bacterium REEB494]|nr:hypothetical protein [Cyanobacteria bacterium REEB494]